MNLFEWQRYRRNQIADGQPDPGAAPPTAPAPAPVDPGIKFEKKGPSLTPEQEAKKAAKLAELLRNR
jgi:hypothetical protein